ncbi:MAG TPA: asparaginase [Candidatus Polarisedimenticolia bacterium]|nr:asparaginase [Candidatus Polarisedimenticolia bacterium]
MVNGSIGEAFRPLVEVWRGDVVESLHFGAVVVAGADGCVTLAHGDPAAVTFLRSAAKPAQILPLLEAGGAERFGLTGAEIAVMIGSHNGEPVHVAAVESILHKIGCEPGALQCGAHPPFHRPSARALREAGAAPTALHNNCSGKHAGMLALARLLGAPIETYVEASHPVQVRILDTIASLSGLPPEAVRTAVDGCSAPTFAMPLGAAATLYARLVDRDVLPEGLRKAAALAVAAMHAHPEMVAGEDRLCTALMRRGREGLVAKIGAEGVYGFAFGAGAKGTGVALKIADGDDDRARPTAALATLTRLGVLAKGDFEDLRMAFAGPIKNRRHRVVGKVVPVLDLRSPSGTA